jgi:hypothetical protein
MEEIKNLLAKQNVTISMQQSKLNKKDEITNSQLQKARIAEQKLVIYRKIVNDCKLREGGKFFKGVSAADPTLAKNRLQLIEKEIMISQL